MVDDGRWEPAFGRADSSRIPTSHEHIMRKIRIAILLAVAATAFTACKKGGGYMTEPTSAVASN
jgi:hypothetical protein